jgi:hypothetical protein
VTTWLEGEAFHLADTHQGARSPNPSGKPELAVLHWPLFPSTHPKETARRPASRAVDLDRESIWISYCPMSLEAREPDFLCRFTSHHRLATPVFPWERLKICGGHSARRDPSRLADHLSRRHQS